MLKKVSLKDAVGSDLAHQVPDQYRGPVPLGPLQRLLGLAEQVDVQQIEDGEKEQQKDQEDPDLKIEASEPT